MICSQNIGAPFALAFHVVQRAKVALERDKQGNYCFKVNLIYPLWLIVVLDPDPEAT